MNRIVAFLLVATSVASAAEPVGTIPWNRPERWEGQGPGKAIAAAPAKDDATKPGKKSGLRYEGGDGSSMEKAVVIKGAKDTSAGVRAEYDWVAKKFPGYQRKQQSLQANGGKRYDVLTIVTKQGKEVDVYFDITEFFGKF